MLRRFANFAWYTGGAESRVDHSSPLGVADMVITADAELVLTSSIEAERMRVEGSPEIEVAEYPWYEEPPLRQLGGPRLGADFPLAGADNVSGEIDALRRVLDADAIGRYRVVGADTAAACREAAASLTPGLTEWEMMAALEAGCRRRGLYTPVAMAAADERSTRYRHPVTAGEVARRRVMLVVCAERGGLYANLTMWVHFEDPGPEWRRRQAAARTFSMPNDARYSFRLDSKPVADEKNPWMTGRISSNQRPR